jgi:hypothetical protein
MSPDAERFLLPRSAVRDTDVDAPIIRVVVSPRALVTRARQSLRGREREYSQPRVDRYGQLVT